LAIDNQVDVTTGTVRLKAIFENQDNMLFPNQFVNARLLVDVQRGAVLIPTAAVQHGPDSDFVYLVKSDDTVELRKVQVGPAEADQTAIQHGLAAGEMVVTEGVDKLQPGAKVVVQGRQPARGGASAESNSTKAAAADRKTPAADAPPADSAGGKASQ
jgi:multidrug efflux system membrane fusion protein